MKKEEYAHLEGREVKVFTGKRTQTGVVRHIDFDYGITITDKDDPNDRLVCVSSPEVFEARTGKATDAESYERLFKVACLMISRGSFANYELAERFAEVDNDYQGLPAHHIIPASACAFSL